MDPEQQRMVDPAHRPEDKIEQSLRPRHLSEIIGQRQLLDNLQILITAARQRHEPVEHILFYGPPGLGKTTLSHVVANEMEVNMKATAGPAIERAGDLAAILTNLKAGDVLFIDEIHRLGKPIEEILYPAMEDCALDLMIGKGPAARALRLKLPPFTLIGATTRLALMSAPLRARFGAIYRIDYYDIQSMQQIVRRAAQILGMPSDESGILEIAQRARGTPRVAIRLLKRVRDFSQVKADGLMNQEVAIHALTLLNVDEKGLDEVDRKVIHTIIQKYNGGPVGLSTIAASISEEPDTIMEVVEPYLLQLGYIERTPQGRVATMLAYEHVQIPYPENKANGQLPLFKNKPQAEETNSAE